KDIADTPPRPGESPADAAHGGVAGLVPGLGSGGLLRPVALAAQGKEAAQAPGGFLPGGHRAAAHRGLLGVFDGGAEGGFGRIGRGRGPLRGSGSALVALALETGKKTGFHRLRAVAVVDIIGHGHQYLTALKRCILPLRRDEPQPDIHPAGPAPASLPSTTIRESPRQITPPARPPQPAAYHRRPVAGTAPQLSRRGRAATHRGPYPRNPVQLAG